VDADDKVICAPIRKAEKRSTPLLRCSPRPTKQIKKLRQIKNFANDFVGPRSGLCVAQKTKSKCYAQSNADYFVDPTSPLLCTGLLCTDKVFYLLGGERMDQSHLCSAQSPDAHGSAKRRCGLVYKNSYYFFSEYTLIINYTLIIYS
jgi:hypothetical protein